MNYIDHLQNLITERNKRELLFKDIIEDYNKLYIDYQEVTSKVKTLECHYTALQTEHHKLKEMTKVTMNPGNLIVNDDYFSN